MKRWQLPILLIFSMAGPLHGRGGPKPPMASVAIMITVDTLRPDRMSLYGYEHDTTPKLQEYFEGSAFANARSTAPCTLPAVKQLLTGRIDMTGASMAQTVKAAGLQTAAVVSQQWFTGDPLYRSGFDHWDPQGREDLDKHGLTTRTAEVVTDRALEWVDTGRQTGERFFLWVHYFDPHDPYNPPMAGRQRAADVDRYLDGDRRSAQLAAWEEDEEWFMVDDIFEDADRDALSRLYDDEIGFVDSQIGRLLDGLDQRGLLNEALVLFTADHGERLGEQGVWDHCYSLHDLELRVPLAVRLPRQSSPLALNSPVSTLDLYPTLLSALSIEGPDELDGGSLLAPFATSVSVSLFKKEMVVTDGDWKLYFECEESSCLPVSLVQLSKGSELDGRQVALSDNPETVARLTDAAARFADQTGEALRKTNREFEALRSLGYVR